MPVLIAIYEAIRQYQTNYVEVSLSSSRSPAKFEGYWNLDLFKRFDRLNKSYVLFSYVLQNIIQDREAN